jgi:hypothetical protein
MEPVHLQINQTSRALAVISRRFEALAESTATYSFWDMTTGAQIGTTGTCPAKQIEANAVTDLDCEAQWPDKTRQGILLLRLQLHGPPAPPTTQKQLSMNEYWLPPPGGVDVEETAWRLWRAWKAESLPVNLTVIATRTASSATEDTRGVSGSQHGGGAAAVGTVLINISLHAPCQTCPGGSGPGSLAIRLGLQRQVDGGTVGGSEAATGDAGRGAADVEDRRILPAFFSENYVTLLPDETRHLTVECRETDLGGGVVELRVDGYNVRSSSTVVTVV